MNTLFDLPPPTQPFGSGYFARPGTGPEGETCGTCLHARSTGNAGKYKKCARLKFRWTHGGGTDIKLRSPACSGWEKISEKSD